MVVADVTIDGDIIVRLRRGQNGLDLITPHHNAGRGLDGEPLQLAPADMRDLFEVNLIGAHRTVTESRAYWADHVHIQLVASVASFLPIPRTGSYCASKGARPSRCRLADGTC